VQIEMAGGFLRLMTRREAIATAPAAFFTCATRMLRPAARRTFATEYVLPVTAAAAPFTSAELAFCTVPPTVIVSVPTTTPSDGSVRRGVAAKGAELATIDVSAKSRSALLLAAIRRSLYVSTGKESRVLSGDRQRRRRNRIAGALPTPVDRWLFVSRL